jgi:peptidoglycan biosynthesis protein MviN/MurJ (putative lipid II flippase)
MSGLSSFIERVRRHWNDPASHDRRIATGFLWVATFVFIGKLAGAAKEMAIAWRYGISDTVDAYVFVFNLVTWPVAVWFGLLSAVLVPLVITLRSDQPDYLRRFRGEVLALTTLLGLGALVISYALLPVLLRSSLAGLSESVVQIALDMARPLSWLLPLGAVIGLFSAWTMACGRHRNTLLEAIPALVILIVLLLPPGWVPDPLVWGTVAGYFLHLVGLALPLSRSGEISRPSLGFDGPSWATFRHGMRVLVIGYALMSVTTVIDQFFAAHLETGAIATLGYSNRILALVLSMGALAINRATLPVFSEAAARGPIHGLVWRWAKWMFLGGLVTAAVLWPMSHWMVKLVFERGAFTEENTKQVAEMLQLFLLQLPFYFYGLVLVSALSSRKEYFAVTVSGIIGVLCRPLLNAVLVPRMGMDGIAVSAAIGYAATSAYMAFRMRNR